MEELNEEMRLVLSGFQEQLTHQLKKLFHRGSLLDVTLACKGGSAKAHQVVLAAYSKYLQELLEDNSHPHPIIFLKEINYNDVQAVLKFLYDGEITISKKSLSSFTRALETLEIRGYVVKKELLQKEGSVDSRQEEATSTDLREPLYKIRKFGSHPEPQLAATPDRLSLQVEDSRSPSILKTPVRRHELQSPSGSSRLSGQRQNWSNVQLQQLEKWFLKNQYPSAETTRVYAVELAAMSPGHSSPTHFSINYWFQNRRRKEKNLMELYY